MPDGPSRTTLAIKRVIDVVLASCALVVLGPFLAAIALWVRLDSPGPALFLQTRVGRGGVPFSIFKFRSMVVDAPALGGALTVRQDARVTRAGRTLRRHKLDELPQLLNVLRGEMSLVGPRPEVPRLMAFYAPAQAARMCTVRPGLTDYASLLFRDESTLLDAAADPEGDYRRLIMPVKYIHIDRYINDISCLTDLRIIIATLAMLLIGRPVLIGEYRMTGDPAPFTTTF